MWEETPVRRRDGLIAGLALAATVKAREKGQPMPTRADQPSLEGEVRFDNQSTAAAADDFGHIVHRTPRAVLLPASAGDVAAAIRWAARHGRSFAPHGQRHSVFGRAQVRDGVVGDMTRLRTICPVRDGRVTVEAGATWREVVAATLPHGQTPPVLTDYLDLSVGGTLVVGGVGAKTSRFGVQSDHVLDMEVVTGRGEVLNCSPHRNTDLFDAVRAGLGQVGVITRATLRLVAAPVRVCRFHLFYRDLGAMLTDQRLIAADDRFEAVQGAITTQPAGGWTFRLEAVKESSGRPPDDDALLGGLSDDRALIKRTTLPYAEYVDRLAVLEQALRANGQWFSAHPWLTTFIGDAAVDATVGAELDRLTPADLGPYGQVVLSPIRKGSITSPLLRLPWDDLCYAFNLIRIPATEDAATVAQQVSDNEAVYQRVSANGGTLYPVSALPMSRAGWRRHFGPDFARFAAAKRRFDPDNVLTPGYEVF
jgi:cytokinin dehydrogenase